MPCPIRVLVADDHEIVRKGFVGLLKNADGIEVVAEAGSGSEAVGAFEAHKPDVVLMDLLMPGMTGIKATQLIRERFPAAKVLGLTAVSDDDQLLALLRAGAIGFLNKRARVEEVITAVRQAAEGVLDPPKTVAVPQPLAAGADVPSSITGREAEVLRLLGRGMSNRDIAKVLEIREATARTHVSRILGKLKLGSRTEAALYAVHRGLV